MNIIVPDSWFREFLKTSVKPEQIAHVLSLCAASVEKVEKVKNDHLYHVEVTTNRVDMASIYGLAREAAAVLPRFGFKAGLKKRSEAKTHLTFKPKVDYLDVKISGLGLCPRFTAILLSNVEIKPSPERIQKRLQRCGIRAVNNVVDVSNYVMLELGQPMHTFDYDKIMGQKIHMRLSKKGETITTLDKEKRELPEGSIIIEDGEGRVIDLCGIMGGGNSAVSEKTKRVLLFVQTYDPVKIRQTCQKMAFRTEAASLFEKSLDPEGVTPALERAVELLEKTTRGKAAKEAIDLYPKPSKPETIELEISLVEKILGVKIPEKEIVKILQSLDFTCQLTNGMARLLATAPSFRDQDMAIPEDLIEEIARLYGYHNLPSSLPTGEIPQAAQDKNLFWEEEVKKALKFWGFSETYTYSMVSEEALVNCGFVPEEALKIANPLNEELAYMRPSLLPSLLAAFQKNQYLKKSLRLFELATIYLPKKGSLPQEKAMLAGVIAGGKFLKAKGIIEQLLKELSIEKVQFLEHATDYTPYANFWHPGRSALVKGGEILGTVGEIHPHILEKFEIEGKITAFDLDFSQIAKMATKTKKYKPIPKYPPIIEDLAVLADKKIKTGDLVEEIKKGSSLITEVSLLDTFKKTRTFHIIYQHQGRNLKSGEVSKIRTKILKALKKKFKAILKE